MGSRWQAACEPPFELDASELEGGNEVDEMHNPASTAASAVPEPRRDLIGNQQESPMTCGPSSIDPVGPRARARELVARVGGHVSWQLDLDLDEPDDRTLGRWLVASALLGGRHGETAGVAACSLLGRAGLLDPQSLATGDPLVVEQYLARARLREPERAAHTLDALLDCGVGQPDDRRAGKPATGYVHLDFHPNGIDTAERRAVQTGNHRAGL